MSSLTRSAASFFSVVSLPIIFVLTGPAAGKVSMIVSDWNLTSASERRGCVTPQAPAQGSVRSSSFIPKRSRPSTYVCIQSLRLDRSSSYSSINSLASEDNTDSGSSSAKFISNSSSGASSGSISSSNPSVRNVTSSGSSISISKSGPCSKPIGAAYKPFSILMIYP